MFLLRSRRPHRYGKDLVQQLKPGDPLYEKIRQEVIDEYEGDEQEVFDSIDKLIDDMVVRRDANEQILAEWKAEDAAADAPEESSPGEPGE